MLPTDSLSRYTVRLTSCMSWEMVAKCGHKIVNHFLPICTDSVRAFRDPSLIQHLLFQPSVSPAQFGEINFIDLVSRLIGDQLWSFSRGLSHPVEHVLFALYDITDTNGKAYTSGDTEFQTTYWCFRLRQELFLLPLPCFPYLVPVFLPSTREREGERKRGNPFHCKQ